MKVYRGDSGLYGTAPDYVKFMGMILDGGQLGQVRILRAETIAMMGKNQIGGLSLYDFKTVIPEQFLDGRVPGGLDKFGLGFAINTKTRYVILDRDSKYDANVLAFLKATGLKPKRTNIGSPWQNGIAE